MNSIQSQFSPHSSILHSPLSTIPIHSIHSHSHLSLLSIHSFSLQYFSHSSIHSHSQSTLLSHHIFLLQIPIHLLPQEFYSNHPHTISIPPHYYHQSQIYTSFLLSSLTYPHSTDIPIPLQSSSIASILLLLPIVHSSMHSLLSLLTHNSQMNSMTNLKQIHMLLH